MAEAPTFRILNMSIWRLLFILIMFTTIFQFASKVIQLTVDVNDIKATVFENRVFYSGAIASVDYETGRIHADTIDFNKFSQEGVLDDAFNYSGSRIAAKLELRNLETENVTEQYMNKVWYERWEPLTSFRGYSKVLKWRYVLIDQGGEISPGVMRTEVVMGRG